MTKQSKNKIPIVINLHNTKYSVLQNAAKQTGIILNYDNDVSSSVFQWDIKWTDMSLGSDIVKKMTKNQRINYFIGISSIARKNLLMVNLNIMKKYFPDDYDFFPQTFQYPSEFKKIIKFYKEKAIVERKVTFIVKPEASCQGRGIYLCQNLNQIQSQSKSIVQQYISRPMLYEGLKFDFRVYVLLKSVSPLQIYIYKQGLVRFATQKYEQPSKFNLEDLCLHLTNYAVNKLNPKYQFNQTISDLKYGHKKSLAQFFKSLQSAGCNSYRCWRQIKDCINKTIISVQPHLHSQYRKAQPKNQNQSLCFQILGFDFMMDQDSKVYLLQVNQSPSFSTETPLDFLVKNFLIKDTLSIILYERDKKRGNLQYRVKRVKTQYDESYTKEQNSSYNQLPSQVLGNYELIFPSSNDSVKKSYQKMLQYVKADYHKTKFYDPQVSFDDLAKLNRRSKSKSPELKIKSKTKDKLSQKYLQINSVQKTKSLSRNFQTNKYRADLLGLIRHTRPLSIDQKPQNLFPSLKKQPHLSLSPNINDVRTHKMLTINLNSIEKQIGLNFIDKNLACPNINGLTPNQFKFSQGKNISPQQTGKKCSSKNQNEKFENNSINLSFSTPRSKIVKNNIQNPASFKILCQKNNYNAKKQAFRSELKKYIKYRNPIQKIMQQRTQAQQEKLSQKQTQ